MTQPSTVQSETFSLTLSRDEANVVVEGLRMLRNCHVYSFKEQDDDVRQLHGPLLAAIERIEAELAGVLAEK